MARLLTDAGGIICRRHHPEMTGTLDWWVRRARLVAVLPGIYAVPELAHLPLTRRRAACLAHPDGVLTGAAAARATFWPGAPLGAVEVAVPTKLRSTDQVRFSRRRIPPELTMDVPPLRCTTPALTAIDVATLEDANAVDIALGAGRSALTTCTTPCARPRTAPGTRPGCRCCSTRMTSPGQRPSVAVTGSSGKPG